MRSLITTLVLVSAVAGDQDIRVPSPWRTFEVDVIEFNHVMDWDRENVVWDMNLCQIICYADVDQGYGFNETTLDWAVIQRDAKGKPQYPSVCKTKDGKYRMVFDHRGEKVAVIARIFRMSFTDFDPEMEDRRIFGENHKLWNDPNSEFEINNRRKIDEQ